MKIEALRRLNRLNELPVMGKEGQLGVVEDALLGLDHWVVRYLVMRARASGRLVLLSPLLLTSRLESAADSLRLPLFAEEVEAIPPLDPRKPVSRSQELEYNLYFCIPDYWAGGGLWGHEETAVALAARLRRDQEEGEAAARSRLLRVGELYGYEVRSGARDVGRVQDLLFEAGSLSIRYAVLELDRGPLRPDKRVLLPPLWVEAADREGSSLSVRLPAEALTEAPEHRPGEPITRAYEENLLLHYNSLEYEV